MTQAEKDLIAALDAKLDRVSADVAQLSADIKVVREMLLGINTTVNELHTMGAEMKKTYTSRLAPLLDMAQNHPLGKLALRKAAAKRG